MDGTVVDRLMRVGALTPEFVAAVKAVDLRNPVLSSERTSLLAFVPATYEFQWFPTGTGAVAGRHPDALATAVIGAIRASAPAAGTPAALLLQRLEAIDPIELLRQDVAQYRTDLENDLNGPSRAAELERLHDKLLALRRAVIDHPVLGTINETGNRLLPLP